jgi:CRISPR system Cascade subunit CasA
MNEQCAYNLITQSLITAAPCGKLTLPGVLAALARDEVESFPALRPHQTMFWHMFLVQLAALALVRVPGADIPDNEMEWTKLLRGLTADFPNDEPWCLVGDDLSKPAFMQASVPKGVTLGNEVLTPDALDLLITSKNHDLKQAVARQGEVEDWVFALVTLQTGEGYGGKGNQGIVRMNGGSSSRPMLTLVPRSTVLGKDMMPRYGAWFRRDVCMLLETRGAQDILDYPQTGGLGLIWLVPWLEDEQLQTRELDVWFIEICRRVRLSRRCGSLSGVKGTSNATRINAKHLNGAVGDPWAPVHNNENKSLTLSGGDFDYRTLTNLLFSGEWERPLLARPASFEAVGEPMSILAMALSRGNSKTEGFKCRTVPIGGKISIALGPKRAELQELAQWQTDAIAAFSEVITGALKLAAVGGNENDLQEKQKSNSNRQKLNEYVRNARGHLDRYADSIFFEHLWQIFESPANTREPVREVFLCNLWQRTQEIFEESLSMMPCPSLYRHRAEARARRHFYGNSTLRRNYPILFGKEENHAS